MQNEISRNVISLGCFCSVALELEKNGLRDASYPFDWLITRDFSKVLHLIETNFDNFLNEDNLIQSISSRNYYYDEIQKIWFYHDFSSNSDLHSQMDDVKEKFNRRINRFYSAIKQPTTFIRYVKNQKDADYINQYSKKIENIIKRFCPHNQIIYFYNDDLVLNVEDSYSVKVDRNDSVSRHPFRQHMDLLENLIENYDDKKREENIKRYNKLTLKRGINKIKIKLNKLLCRLGVVKEYSHSKVIK
ncbi:MAG: hypothetical protein J1E85_01470 [Ruminococcus sp.]|nr:hypothetical protein [Ruminococcus sp.]